MWFSTIHSSNPSKIVYMYAISATGQFMDKNLKKYFSNNTSDVNWVSSK